MKSIKEMTKEELLTYCAQLKVSGSSFRELAAMFDKHDVDQEYRKFVINGLDSLDRKQRKSREENERINNLGSSIKNLVVGIAFIISAIVLYNVTSKVGVVFIFNVVVIAVGGLLILRGIVALIKSRTT